MTKRFTMSMSIDLPDGVFAEAAMMTIIKEWIDEATETMPAGMTMTIHPVRKARDAKAPVAEPTIT